MVPAGFERGQEFELIGERFQDGVRRIFFICIYSAVACMSEPVTITLSHDEALVLFDFFARFDESGDFTLRNTAEYLAFCRISAQLDKSLAEPLKPDYTALLKAARDRLAEGYEGCAPGVVYE
jgi:hypothetical protein